MQLQSLNTAVGTSGMRLSNVLTDCVAYGDYGGRAIRCSQSLMTILTRFQRITFRVTQSMTGPQLHTGESIRRYETQRAHCSYLAHMVITVRTSSRIIFVPLPEHAVRNVQRHITCIW